MARRKKVSVRHVLKYQPFGNPEKWGMRIAVPVPRTPKKNNPSTVHGRRVASPRTKSPRRTRSPPRTKSPRRTRSPPRTPPSAASSDWSVSVMSPLG